MSDRGGSTIPALAAPAVMLVPQPVAARPLSVDGSPARSMPGARAAAAADATPTVTVGVARRRRQLLALVLATGALLLATACRRREAPAVEAATPAPRLAPRSAASPPPSPDWVKVYDPALASNGYTLTLHDARTPVLLDMNGRVVHSWPGARLRSR